MPHPSLLVFYLAIIHLLHHTILSTPSGEIDQVNPLHHSPRIEFNIDPLLTHHSCVVFSAKGIWTKLSVDINFNPLQEILAYPSDILLSVHEIETDSSHAHCFQYGGYNYYYPNCGLLSKWPDTWNTAASGRYMKTIDVSSAGFSGNKVYEFCIGMGWHGVNSEVSIRGSIDFYQSNVYVSANLPSHVPSSVPTLPWTPLNISMTSQPSHTPTRIPTNRPTVTPTLLLPPLPQSIPIDIRSSCDELLSLSFDTLLAAGEQTCLTVAASGQLDRAVVNMLFRRESFGVSGPNDMTVTIEQVSTNIGVWLGGAEYMDSSTSDYEFQLWPKSWQSIRSFSENFADLDLTAANISGTGLFRVCLMNSYAQAGTVRYIGNISLASLTTVCDMALPIPSTSPSASPSATVAPSTTVSQVLELSQLENVARIKFDLKLRGGESDCTNLTIGGRLQNISLNLLFFGNGVSWASDFLISVRDRSTGHCFQVYGSTIDIVLFACDGDKHWPDTMNVGDITHHSVSIDVFSLIDDGFRAHEVCLMNAYSSSGYVSYQGDVVLTGLISTLMPTPVPSSALIVRHAVPSNISSGSFFEIVLLICIVSGSCMCFVGLVAWYRRYMLIYTRSVPLSDYPDIECGEEVRKSAVPENPCFRFVELLRILIWSRGDEASVLNRVHIGESAARSIKRENVIDMQVRRRDIHIAPIELVQGDGEDICRSNSEKSLGFPVVYRVGPDHSTALGTNDIIVKF